MAPSQEAARRPDPKPALPEAPALARIAAAARRILGIGETRVVGGLSRTVRPPHEALDRPLPLSSFQMLGLDEIRAKLGDRWPQMRDKVHLIARNTIAKHLIRGDVFEPHGEDGYLVLFASLGAAEAEFKSRVIAREIAEHLLGESDAAAIKVTACVTELTHEELAGPDQGSALTKVLARIDSGEDETVTTVAAILREELGGGGAGPARSPAVRGSRALEAPPAYAFTPVWDTAQMTLLRYRTAAPDLVGETETFEADLALVRAAGEELRLLAESGQRRPLTIVVRQTSLGGNAQRAAIRQAVTAVAPSLRRLLTIEVALRRGEEWSYGSRSFLEAAGASGCGFSVLVDLDCPHPLPAEPALKDAGVTLSQIEASSEAESLRLLAAFARTKAQGFIAAAHGLGTRSLVLGAIAAGFRYLSGPAVHPDYDNLGAAVRFEAADLYRDLAAGVRGSKGP